MVVVFVTRSIIDITVFPMHIWKPVRKLKDKYRLRYEQKKKNWRKFSFQQFNNVFDTKTGIMNVWCMIRNTHCPNNGFPCIIRGGYTKNVRNFFSFFFLCSISGRSIDLDRREKEKNDWIPMNSGAVSILVWTTGKKIIFFIFISSILWRWFRRQRRRIKKQNSEGEQTMWLHETESEHRNYSNIFVFKL